MSFEWPKLPIFMKGCQTEYHFFGQLCNKVLGRVQRRHKALEEVSLCIWRAPFLREYPFRGIEGILWLLLKSQGNLMPISILCPRYVYSLGMGI